ncbi:MAG: hypothetical protein N2V75_03945 [Methanophagales archaeon]|nr:hypothetical protein [Methanophagales archaeon]
MRRKLRINIPNQCKKEQEKVFESIERVEAIEFLKDIGIISLHDYWIIIGKYRIVY